MNNNFVDLDAEALRTNYDLKLGKRLEAYIKDKRGKDWQWSDLEKIIKEETNLKLNIVSDGKTYQAAVLTTDLGSNVIESKYHKWHTKASDAKRMSTKTGFLEGSVDLVNYRVSGAFADIASSMYFGENWFNASSNYTPAEFTSVILHEIGHVFYNFLTMAFSSRTLLCMEEALDNYDPNAATDVKIKLMTKLADGRNLKKWKPEQAATVAKDKKSLISVAVAVSREDFYNEVKMDLFAERANEHLADTFATKCGYGVPLVTSLSKMYPAGRSSKALHVIAGLTKFFLWFLKLSLAGPIGALIFIFMSLINGLFYDLRAPYEYMYDKPRDRFIAIKKKIIAGLKTEKNKNLRRTMVKELDKIDKVLETVDNKTTNYQWFFKTLSPRGRRGHSAIEYCNSIERLADNNLFHTAHSLEA